MKTMHPKLMETVFLANHVVLEGFDDISKAEEYKKDFGDEIAGKLEPFSDTKMKVVKQDEESGHYIGRFKQLKDVKTSEFQKSKTFTPTTTDAMVRKPTGPPGASYIER